MIASPALNPAAIALTFMLFDPRIAAARLVLSLAAVLTIGAVVESVFPATKFKFNPQIPEVVAEAGSAPVLFLRSVASVGLQTIPALVAGVLVSMVIVQSVFASVGPSAQVKSFGILFIATLAVPLALPTFLEIPLALSLLAAGFPSGAALALLFAGPAINLSSLISVSRLAGWKIAAAAAALIWCFAIGGGLLIG
jgi:uncharacterized membrane protein YraQ (UPF0718 family)